MDETACQSVTNVRRVLHAPNTKNIQVHCGERLKINVVGFMGVNCSSYMETNERGDSINFVKALCRFRMENMLNAEAKQLIKEAITNSNLEDEYIKRILAQKSLNGMDLINKVNDELYNDKHSNQESIAKIKKMLNKEDSNNPYKIKKEREKRLVTVKNLTDNFIFACFIEDMIFNPFEVVDFDLSYCSCVCSINSFYFSRKCYFKQQFN